MLWCAFLLAAAAEPPPLDVRAICARVRCPDDYNYTRYVDESGACRCGLLTHVDLLDRLEEVVEAPLVDDHGLDVCRESGGGN